MKKIIAINFGGAFVTSEFPDIETVNKLKAEQLSGAKIILLTRRVAQQLNDALEWYRARGINFDAVNENLGEILKEFNTEVVSFTILKKKL